MYLLLLRFHLFEIIFRSIKGHKAMVPGKIINLKDQGASLVAESNKAIPFIRKYKEKRTPATR